MYAWVDVGGLYRSDNGGKRWRMLHGSFPRSLTPAVAGVSVDPRNPDRVIALHGDRWFEPDGIIQSNDGGRTWKNRQRIHFFGNGEYRWKGQQIARDPRNPDRLLVSSPVDGLWLSTNNGNTWRSVGQRGYYFHHVQFDRTNPRRMYACATPWNGWAIGGEFRGKGGFFRSDDSGETWQKLPDEAPGEMVQLPGSPHHLVGIFGDREFRISGDGGATWQDFHQGLPRDTAPDLSWQSPGRFQAIAVGPDFLATGSAAGRFYTRRAADSAWQTVSVGKVTERVEGQPWYAAWNGLGYRHFASALASLTIDPRNPRRWFMTDWYAVYESTDVGVNWTLRNDGIETTVIHAFGQFPDDPGRVLMGMADNAHFVSTDGGERWQKRSANSNTRMFAISAALPERVFAITDPPGQSEWRTSVVQVSPDRGETYFLAPARGLPDRTKHSVNSIIADQTRPNRIWVTLSGKIGDGGGLYRSDDAGATFHKDSAGLPESEDLFWGSVWENGPEVARSLDGTMITVSRRTGQVYRRGKDTDAFTRVSVDFPTNAALADTRESQTFWVGGDKGLFRSTDGGQNFTRVFTEPANYIAQDRVRPDRIAVGSAYNGFLSEDGGKTFRPFAAGLPHATNLRVGFGSDRLLAGTGGSGVFWMPLTTAAARPQTAISRPNTEVGNPFDAFWDGQNLLTNAQFENGLEGWAITWTGEGKLSLQHVTDAPRRGTGHLRLRSEGGPAYGSTGQSLPVQHRQLEIAGSARVTGSLTEALVAIQAFRGSEQVAFRVVAVLSDASEWRDFQGGVTLPEGATSVNFTVVLRGQGTIELDNLRVVPKP